MGALRIEVADLSLAALDALDVDSLAVFVGPERPLQGLAGWVDWRLCGALSHALRDRFYGGGEREALLLPSAGRVGASRVFFFGLPPLPLDAAGFAAFARTACGALAKAGSASFATSLPPLEGPAARLWLEAILDRPVARQVLLGDARALHRDLVAAREALGARGAGVEIALAAEGRAAGAALPVGASVVR
ncbi:MAG TPA: peptidase M17 [Anaeromyxobacteraceae bacterium]|nr:peptidase M17 [Anaeromyxobacteraceae bacterium]